MLSAAMLLLVNTVIQGPNAAAADISDANLRFLLAVGLRPFGDPAYLAGKQRAGKQTDFTGAGSGTVACAAGALDFGVPINATVQSAASQVFNIDADARLLCMLNDDESNELSADTKCVADCEDEFLRYYWGVARYCRDMGRRLVDDWAFVPESVRLFGFGMDSPVDILKAVEIDARSNTLGRGFTTGVSNMGVVTFEGAPLPPATPAAAAAVVLEQGGSKESSSINSSSSESSSSPMVENFLSMFKIGSSSSIGSKGKAGPLADLRVESGYYGVSHGRNGVLCLLSTMTVNGRLSGCLQFTSPLGKHSFILFLLKSGQFC
jgi:hypothetical protein